MGLFRVDLTAFPEGVRKRMQEIWTREDLVEMQRARIRQEKIATFYRDNEPRWRDGFGPMVMAVDPYWASYFAEQHGAEAQEKEFQDWLRKREPVFGVKARSGKVQVGWREGAGGRGQETGDRRQIVEARR